MKLTRGIFEKSIKFRIVEDNEFDYEYSFCYLRKVDKQGYINESYLCNNYKNYFIVYIDFFGISLSKKIYYKNCIVIE